MKDLNEKIHLNSPFVSVGRQKSPSPTLSSKLKHVHTCHCYTIGANIERAKGKSHGLEQYKVDFTEFMNLEMSVKYKTQFQYWKPILILYSYGQGKLACIFRFE